MIEKFVHVFTCRENVKIGKRNEIYGIYGFIKILGRTEKYAIKKFFIDFG